MSPSGRRAGFLGWFSLGLGAAELLAPRRLARGIGVEDTAENEALIRAIGLREIVSGVGILSNRRPVGWLWSRVGGDVMDLSLLTRALETDDTEKRKVGMALTAVAGVTILDLYCSQQFPRDSAATLYGNGMGKEQKMDVKQAITINRPQEELYQFWRDFEHLPRFMYHLEEVQVLDGTRSHWKVKGPAGKKVEWDAEIVDDQPNRQIGWRSLPEADVDNSGVVRFERAPGGRGTTVKVEMHYSPPAGVVGEVVAKLYGESPEKQVWEDLHRLKQLLETGAIVRSDGSLEGMGSSQRPAQPPPAVPG